MKTHFASFTDLEDLEQAPCGTWLGESSELSGDWAEVDCLHCKKRRERIIAAAGDEERFIVEQMGDMAAFMRAVDEEPTWSCQPCKLEQPTDRMCDVCGGKTDLMVAKT